MDNPRLRPSSTLGLGRRLARLLRKSGDQRNPVDFAGGTVVHIASGFSAIALALVVGKRLGFGEHEFPPHDIPLTLIGAAILWFGFNAGSALAANANAANALMVTHIAACAGTLSWAS